MANPLFQPTAHSGQKVLRRCDGAFRQARWVALFRSSDHNGYETNRWIKGSDV